MRFLAILPWRAWICVSIAGIGATWLWWYGELPTHLAGQMWPRTILSLEVLPVLMLAVSTLLLRQRAPWLALGSPRHMQWWYVGTSVVVTLPPVITPPLVWLMLKTGSAYWIPGARHFPELTAATLGEVVPLDFMWMLVPTLLICAGSGLAVEGALGRGAGGAGPLVAFGGIVGAQSLGFLGLLPGFPGADAHLSPAAWGVGVAAIAVGVLIFGSQLGGARGLLIRR